ncbi:MAG: hypothetical protein AB1777_05995 [Bacteroidota bacterium]
MNSPYFLIPISLAITLYYLLGSLMAQAGIIAVSTLRRFWNFTLLFNFLGCAVLGILLTININYKLGWSFVKVILSWHVQLGIAMSVVAFIHTLWHRGYFSKYLSFKSLQTESENIEPTHLLLLAFVLGLLSVSLQVLLIKQFTKVFQGNEFLVTWAIGIWMLISGAGALVGSKSSNGINTKKVITKALWFMFGSALLFIFLSGVIRQTFFPSGVLIAPYYVIIMVTLMMVSVALPSGMIYALLTKRIKSEYPTVYAYEALGSLSGGLLVSLVIIWFLNIYLATIAIGFIASSILVFTQKKPVKVLVPLTLLISGIGIKVFNIDVYAETILLPGQKVLSVSDSPYGSITVTGSDEQINFFQNGAMLFGTQNLIYREETVHYVMAQRNTPQKVLLVSGGYTGLTDELSKYKLIKVDYFEPNPQLLNESKRFCKQSLPKYINVVKGDIRNFLRKSTEMYDIAIIATPEPTSLEQNRYFTLDFLRRLKKRLTKSAVVCYNLAGIGNYASEPKQKAYSSIAFTLKSVFSNVEVITGERDYLLASDSTIRIDMARLLSERTVGEANLYVRPDYINDEHIAQRNQFFHEQIAFTQRLNTDNHPWPVLQNTLGYLLMFGNRTWVLLVIGFLLLLTPLFFLQKQLQPMYIVGFAGSAIQTLYLLTLQVCAGLLYGALGAMIALFMGGLAAGSISHGRFQYLNTNRIKTLLTLSFVILIALWLSLDYMGIWLLVAILSIGTLMASFSVGYLYVSITGCSGSSSNQPARTYAADLLGSATGIVAVTLLLIPSIGFIATAIALALAIGVYLLLNG